jgi:hypothetical protein
VGTIDKRTLRLRRGYVYLLMALCVFLTSGPTRSVPSSNVGVAATLGTPRPAAFASPASDGAERIAVVLGTINPSL